MADKIVVQTLVPGTVATCICQKCARKYQEEIHLTCTEFVPMCECSCPSPWIQFRYLTHKCKGG